MSGLEVIGAVAAVVSAFHGGAELVAHIKKKHRRRNSKSQTQQDFEEKQLQDSLQTGETQVVQRYAFDVKELGEIARIGDAIARDRLLHIAVVMQAEIIKSLQLAVKYDNAILNLKILHEASIVNRKDSIVTLDEMKQRILITRPLPRTLTGAPEERRDSKSSIESVQTFRPANFSPVPDNYIPSAVTIPAPGDSKDSKTGLARYFSMKRNSNQTSTSQQPRPPSAADSFSFSPALNNLLQGPDRASIMKDIDEIISSYQGLQVDDNRRDTLAILNGGGHSKRDTLAILHGGDNYNRDTMDANNDALNFLKSLPPTPEETHDPTEYPAFNLNRKVFDPEQAYSQYITSQNPLPPLPRPTQVESRWSGSSSIYSDTVPPSLYSHGSISSRESPVLSQSADFGQQPYRPPTQHFAVPQRPHTPPYAPPNVLHRNRTPPDIQSLTPRSRTPVQDEKGALKSGKTRVLLVPNSSSSSSPVSATSPIAPGLAILAATAGSVIGASAIPPAPKPTSLSHSRSTSSSNSTPSTPSIRTNTIQGPISGTETMMSGRPCKDNNYWGFCKGAWAVREEQKRGLQIQSRPDGLYNAHQVWQCRNCHFTGSTHTASHPFKKHKKELIVDPKVHTSAVGIRYRWIFLAKSHVKKRMMDSGRSPITNKKENEDECNYGCVICSVEGNVTGIYGNVETLMNHIFLEHVSTMSDRTLAKSRCIVGRKAGADEDWDLNIPMTDGLVS